MDRSLAPRLDASDIVQETLLRAHRSRDKIAGASDESCLIWLRSILSNTMATAWRDHHRAKRDRRREISLERSIDASSVQILQLAADVSSPSDGLERQELVLRIASALVELSEDQRRVFLLRHCDEKPVSEIARSLGKTRQAVASLLRRATVSLRDALRSARE